MKPLMEGPLHEAFLSPRKDRIPVAKLKGAPPAALRAARRRSAQRQRGMDRRLLGVGCGPKGFRLGDGNMASSPAGAILGQRLLEARRPGLVSRGRILERAENGPARLPQERTAAGPARRRPGRSTVRRLFLYPGSVLSRWRRRRLEEGVLDQSTARLGLGPCAVAAPARRLGLPGRLLGPSTSRIGEPCSLPRPWIQARAGLTTWSINPIPRSHRRCTAS